MRKTTMGLLLSLFLIPGVASAHERYEPFHTVTTPSERLVPMVKTLPASATQPLGLTVAPVQLDQQQLVDANGDAQDARVNEAIVYTTCDRAHMDCVDYVQSVYHAPTLPYGAFFVQIDNPTNLPLTVKPSQLSMVEHGKTRAVVADEKKLEKRWNDALWADYEMNVDSHPFTPRTETTLHNRLTVMNSDVVVPANGTWSGYVVFDVSATSAEDYASFLRDAQQVQVKLTLPTATATTTFTTSI